MGQQSDRPEFLLRLRPERGGPPDMVKLRRLLKALLRGYGLRCVSVEPAPEPREPKQGDR